MQNQCKDRLHLRRTLDLNKTIRVRLHSHQTSDLQEDRPMVHQACLVPVVPVVHLLVEWVDQVPIKCKCLCDRASNRHSPQIAQKVPR